VEALKNEPEGWVRSEQAWALGLLGSGEGVEEALIHLFEDPVSRARANAVEALHRIGAKNFQELALPLLQDQDRRVRANTALALAHTHWKEAHSCLEKLSVSPDRLDRQAAIFSLQTIPLERRRGILFPMKDDPDPDIRDRVKVMLAQT
jgi:HEAT repeat protein